MPDRVRATVHWFGNGRFVDTETREAIRGPELHELLAAWSDRELMAQIDIAPAGDEAGVGDG